MMRPWALPVSLVLCGAAVAASPFRAGEPVPGAAVLLAFLPLAAVASPLVLPRSSGLAQARRRSAADGRPIVFWRPGCVYCLRQGARLGRDARRPHRVDIWRDPEGAAAVREADGGDETVPTVLADGRTRTDPGPAWVRALSRRAWPPGAAYRRRALPLGTAAAHCFRPARRTAGRTEAGRSPSVVPQHKGAVRPSRPEGVTPGEAPALHGAPSRPRRDEKYGPATESVHSARTAASGGRLEVSGPVEGAVPESVAGPLFRKGVTTLSVTGPAHHAVMHSLGAPQHRPRSAFPPDPSSPPREGAMRSRQVMTVAVLAAVLAWSTVMTVLGQLAAVGALLPSLGLLIQQIVSAFGTPGTRPGTPATAPATATVPAGSEEPTR
ncbi:hypothetical protein GCM10010240_37320 [Streptomyces griseoviridis]|nr:hypothetical protein GCM10010240_37320 [Streptomyces griseoviridis]